MLIELALREAIVAALATVTLDAEKAGADQIRMDRGLRGVDREPWNAVGANNELVLARFRDQRGMRSFGAYVLEVYPGDGA